MQLKEYAYLIQCHATDLPETFDRFVLQDYLIHFVNGLDPNFGSDLPNWPPYNTTAQLLLTIPDGNGQITLTPDTFREDAISLVSQVQEEFPM